MKLFDSHNHVQDERLLPDIGNVMRRASEAGVVAMGVKGCCEADWPRVVELMDSYDGIHPSFGLHPWFVKERTSNWLAALESLLREHSQAGVGEIGIDHAIEDRDDEGQEAVFLSQLELARKLERPVSIHCRRAWGRLIELLDGFGELPRGLLIHCFGGSAEIAKELVKRGAYISFSGSITRPNNRKAGAAINAVPDDRILIETDAPDILPFNVGGASSSVRKNQRTLPGVTKLERLLSAGAITSTLLNEPANVRWVLAKAAELRGMPQAELAELTFANAQRFFG